MDKTPIIKIGPVLLLSIQSELYDRQAEELQTRLLHTVKETAVDAVVLDISSLEMVDSFIGRVLNETAAMIEILNAKVVMVGMQPAVTMTLLELGLDLAGIETALDLEDGLWKLGYQLKVGIRGDDQSHETLA